MKNKNNKKGFTLIELLAVIVVLAIIMIIAVPSIIDAMNNAKKKSFQMYGQKMLKSALEVYESNQLLGGTGTNHVISSTDKPCYTLDDLGLGTSHGSYQGFVRFEPSTLIGADGKNATKYYLYLTDNTYLYNDTVSTTVEGDTGAIKLVGSGADTLELSAAQELMTTCVSKTDE